jgi:hypothetical protein
MTEMTLQDLQRRLIFLENEWDAGEINDQEFDARAAKAAMQWARAARKELLGQT